MYCMAYIAAAHGIRGEVYLKFDEALGSAALKNLLTEKKITLCSSQYAKSVDESAHLAPATSSGHGFVLEKMRHHKQGLLLKLEGVDTRTQAEHLVGWQWQAEKILGLPELQSYQLLNKQKQLLGLVEDVRVYKDCVWLNIKTAQKTFLVPFVNSLVLHEDKLAKKIYMDLPAGLSTLA